MKKLLARLSFAAPWTRLSYLAGFPVFAVVTARIILDLTGYREPQRLFTLLAVYLALYLISPLLARNRWLTVIYLIAQTALVQRLGTLPPYLDMWALLYIPLALQLRPLFSTTTANIWKILFSLSTILTMVTFFGLISGLGRSLVILIAGALLLYYQTTYRDAESARQESAELLEKLRRAHQKLEEYASQAEELASAREHERLVSELHDSVGQMIFSITLNSQAATLMLDSHPERLPGQLEVLKGLTGQALSKMRALISEWRPG